MLEQGKTEKTIIEQCVRFKRPLPKTIEEAPQLEPGLDLFYIAFMDLNSERHLGQVEGPIPWHAVRRYCRELGIIGSQCEDMHYHISKLDAVYLEHKAKQLSKGKNSDGPKIIRPQNAGNGPRR